MKMSRCHRNRHEHCLVSRGHLVADRQHTKKEAAFLLLLPALLSVVRTDCPNAVDIKPCTCSEQSNDTYLYCWGDLSLPQLTTILRDHMCGRNVKKIDIMATNVTYLPSNLFSNMLVEEINIHATVIRQFTQGGQSAFYGLEGSLSSLAMRRCSLLDNLEWQFLGQLYTLSYLDLSSNELTRIPTAWTEDPPPKLRSLFLRKNKISALEPGPLQWMFSLVELDLSENWITTLSREDLPYPGNSLIILRLSYNKLQNISEDAFDGLLSLKRIYFDNNNIIEVSEKTWRPIWGDLEVLDLSGNQLQCDNTTLWLTSLRQPVRLYGECANSDLQGKPLKALTFDDLVPG